MALISHASKVMLKILQTRLQQYVNREFSDVQTEFRKGRGTRDQIANIHWTIEKAEEIQENIYFCFIDQAKDFDFVDHNKLWKFLKKWEYHTTLPAFWETCMQVKKQQLELDMEKQTGSKLRKSTLRLYVVHPVYLTYMQSTSWEILGWMKHKLKSKLPGEISYAHDTSLSAEIEEELQSLLMKVKEGSEKVTQHS